MRSQLKSLVVVLTLSVSALGLAQAATDAGAVVETYADIALAKYEDSLSTARNLEAAVDALLANPSQATLQAAR